MKKNLILGSILFVMTASVAFAEDYILDVRAPDEIAETGMIQGAINADFSNPEFAKNFLALDLPKTDKILLYCNSGRRANQVKFQIKKLGYNNVEVLGGYEEAAKKLNLPLVKPQE